SKVYTNKKALKGDADGIFITENLTQYRTGLTQKLADLKYNHKIFAYWTSDGRIFAKTTEKGTKKLIKNYDDITALETTTDDDNQQQEQIYPQVPPIRTAMRTTIMAHIRLQKHK
ncbi:Hypothetical predicted protein, partial [Mytilus galloprovincialis]